MNITNSIQKRSQLLNVVTRNITVLISGFCSTDISNHQIAEILITGRFVFSLQKIKNILCFCLTYEIPPLHQTVYKYLPSFTGK
jgi:hypothetical protein